jgi:hypothetical protein
LELLGAIVHLKPIDSGGLLDAVGLQNGDAKSLRNLQDTNAVIVMHMDTRTQTYTQTHTHTTLMTETHTNVHALERRRSDLCSRQQKGPTSSTQPKIANDHPNTLRSFALI